MSSANVSLSWWASTVTRSRWTTVAAAGIALALVAVSFAVWVSPSNPIGPTGAIQAQHKQTLAEGERAELAKSVTALRGQLASSRAQLAAATETTQMQSASIDSLRGQLRHSQVRLAAKLRIIARTAPVPAAIAAPTAAAAIKAPSLASLVSPASRYFGMYTTQAPFNWGTYDDVSSKIGVKPNVVGFFSGWDEKYRSTAVEKAWARNTVPVMTWESRPIKAGNDEVNAPAYSLPKILDGDFDAYLHSYAKSVVATGLPLGIRFDHEMNGDWYPWAESKSTGASVNGNRVGDYAKVWRHVHDIFEDEGANKYVFWIWAPNIVNNINAPHNDPSYLASLYPGDDYVDWVGLSGYLRPKYKADNSFSFDYTFGPSLGQLRTLTNKPIVLAEIGASEIGGHKEKWIDSLFDALAKPENSDIVGFNWFDMAVTSYTGGELTTNDWRIESRSSTLNTFSTGIHRTDIGYALKTAQ